jgi:hypothetical protein
MSQGCFEIKDCNLPVCHSKTCKSDKHKKTLVCKTKHCKLRSSCNFAVEEVVLVYGF